MYIYIYIYIDIQIIYYYITLDARVPPPKEGESLVKGSPFP